MNDRDAFERRLMAPGPVDATAILIFADWCADNDLTELEALLRRPDAPAAVRLWRDMRNFRTGAGFRVYTLEWAFVAVDAVTAYREGLTHLGMMVTTAVAPALHNLTAAAANVLRRTYIPPASITPANHRS